MSDDLTALRRFIARQLEEDLSLATGAGHGFGHLPIGTLEHDRTNPGWTRLGYTDNLRPDYDRRFAAAFSPDRVAADIERTLAILEVADRDTLVIIASAWPQAPGFDPAWERKPATGRQVHDHLDALTGRSPSGESA